MISSKEGACEACFFAMMITSRSQNTDVPKGLAKALMWVLRRWEESQIEELQEKKLSGSKWALAEQHFGPIGDCRHRQLDKHDRLTNTFLGSDKIRREFYNEYEITAKRVREKK